MCVTPHCTFWFIYCTFGGRERQAEYQVFFSNGLMVSRFRFRAVLDQGPLRNRMRFSDNHQFRFLSDDFSRVVVSLFQSYPVTPDGHRPLHREVLPAILLPKLQMQQL